jgi:hypothetical protein
MFPILYSKSRSSTMTSSVIPFVPRYIRAGTTFCQAIIG